MTELPLALRLRHVTKHYDTTPPVRALDDVSLDVAAGEMLAIVGPSGSGKSTLLQVAGTLDRPTEGSVIVSGIDTSDLSDNQLSALRGQSIGFVFQQFFLLGGMSALDNVAMGLLYHGVAPAARAQAARDALDRVGLGHRSHHIPATMSGGERQRVAIARALVARPQLVLADEPTGNLDSKSSASVMELLTELNRAGTTIVIITHDPEIAAGVPRHVTIADGRITHDESTLMGDDRDER